MSISILDVLSIITPFSSYEDDGIYHNLKISGSLYKEVAEAYSLIYDALSSLEENGKSATNNVIDITTNLYDGTTGENGSARLVELALLKTFNNAYLSSKNVVSSLTNYLLPIRKLNNLVINGATYGSDNKSKLDYFINNEVIWDNGYVPNGWVALCDTAGYDTSSWIIGVNLIPYTVAQYKMNDKTDDSTIINNIAEPNADILTNTDDSLYTSDSSVLGKTGDAIYINHPLRCSEFCEYINTHQSFQSLFRGNFSINFWLNLDSPTVSDSEASSLIMEHSGGGIGTCTFRIRAGSYGTLSVHLSRSLNDLYLSTSPWSSYDYGTPTGWVMVTVVFKTVGSTSTLSLYLDSVLLGSSSEETTFADFTNSSDFIFGHISLEDNDPVGFEGSLDNVCFFNKDLSQLEIDFLYNGSIGTEDLNN